jgi:hypothetical protein
MQNRCGAIGTNAEVWNHPGRRNGENSCRGIFSRAAVPR